MGTNNGGPAFPVPGLQQDEDFNGMSLHSRRSSCALKGLLANPSIIDTLDQGALELVSIAAARIANLMVERAK